MKQVFEKHVGEAREWPKISSLNVQQVRYNMINIILFLLV